MALNLKDRRALESLELRIETILPEEYRDNYEDIQPASMGSAALKYSADGRVAWDEIWKTFCDLAMAGGPPHRGTLLEPATQDQIDAQPDRHQQVVDEICRGINIVTGLPATVSPIPGWVCVDCGDAGMAGWLVRAIVMENVSVHCEATMLHLPAGPHYRLVKEIKNVITVVAKTCHYWKGHMWSAQHRIIIDLFAMTEEESPLIQPALLLSETNNDKVANAVHRQTGLQTIQSPYANWLGVTCPDIRSAIWMMRALVVSNVLARREDTTLFLPINPLTDPGGNKLAQITARISRFAKAKHIPSNPPVLT